LDTFGFELSQPCIDPKAGLSGPAINAGYPLRQKDHFQIEGER